MDGWGGEPVTDVRSPFEEDGAFSRQITLTLDAPPLSLPGDEGAPSTSMLPPRSGLSVDALPYVDGWTADRLKRSSLPPAAVVELSARQPPPPSTEISLSEAASEGESDAFALVARATASVAPPAVDLVSEMAERFALGDFSGSLRAAELLLGQTPDHALARHYATESRDKLERLYTSRLEGHGRIPVVGVAESEIRWLGLDPQGSFLLSRIDGSSDYDTVIAESGLPRLAALRALVELVDAKVVRLV